MRNESQFLLPRPVWQATEKWEKTENPKKGCLRGMRLGTIKNRYRGKKAAVPSCEKEGRGWESTAERTTGDHGLKSA